MEGIDVCVICEAQNLTKKSFVDLDPTIRRAGSEIWIQFNEQFDDDFVYQFCVVNPPENLICEQVLYTDNPWTSPEIYEQAERMRREDPILFRNVWLGECLGQGGRVLPMFSKTVHLIDFDHTFLPQCDLYMSIDPHRKYYPAIGWSAVTPTGCLIDYNEWPKKEDLGMWYDEARNVKQFDMSIKELANIILANDMTNAYGGKVIARTCDPRFAAENPDFIRALMENGVMGWVTAPYERIETQRENFKQLMAYNPNIPIVGANAPGYYVDRDCSNIIRANLHHCWTQDKDKEAETHKDFIDRMRYLLSIMDGKPRFGERRAAQPIGEIKSLANQMLSGMPAQGYFRTPKK
jgi:hypothetical protein